MTKHVSNMTFTSSEMLTEVIAHDFIVLLAAAYAEQERLRRRVSAVHCTCGYTDVQPDEREQEDAWEAEAAEKSRANAMTMASAVVDAIFANYEESAP